MRIIELDKSYLLVKAKFGNTFLVTLKDVKDRRYNALKTYIDSGAIKSFTEIFDIIPKSTVIADSGINYARLTNKISNPEKFTVKDIIIISQLIGIDSRKLYDLIAGAVQKPTRKK